MGVLGAIRRLRRVVGVAAFAALPLLSGCGGGGGDGGDGGQDLYVNYSYGTATLELWAPASYAPYIGGLDGKTPRCSINSGGPLPPGLVFESAGCRIQGTPLDVGSWSGTITLTVDGYKGSLSSSAAIQVPRPRLTTPGRSPAVTWAAPFSITPLTLFDFTVLPGDQVTYTLLSTLPDGVAFDGATGRLAGSTIVTPQFLLTTQATVARAGRSVTTDPVAIPIGVVQSSLSYTACCDYVWAVPFQTQPISQPTLPPGATMTYTMETGARVPPGMTLDPATGVISGAPLEFDPTHPSYWGATIRRTIVSSTGETYTATQPMWPSLIMPVLRYGNPVDPAHLRPNQPYNFGLPVYFNTLPGDVVSNFAVEGRYPNDGPAPAWLQVTPTTGELVVTPPPNPNPGPFPQPQWNQDYIVTYTITRNGITRNGATGLGFYVDPL